MTEWLHQFGFREQPKMHVLLELKSAAFLEACGFFLGNERHHIYFPSRPTASWKAAALFGFTPGLFDSPNTHTHGDCSNIFGGKSEWRCSKQTNQFLSLNRRFMWVYTCKGSCLTFHIGQFDISLSNTLKISIFAVKLKFLECSEMGGYIHTQLQSRQFFPCSWGGDHKSARGGEFDNIHSGQIKCRDLKNGQ